MFPAVIDSDTRPPVYSVCMNGLLWDDLLSLLTPAAILLPLPPSIGLDELIACGRGFSSRNCCAFSPIIVFFWAIIFFKLAIQLRQVSFFDGRGGQDCLRVAESDDRLLLLLLLSSNDVIHVPHLTALKLSETLFFLTMLVLY